MKQMIVWMGALVVGAVIGLLNMEAVNATADVVATVFTRLFQLLAVPTIVLAVVNTMSTMGTGRNSGRLFRRTLTYTLLTTFSAAAVGAILYMAVSPSEEVVGGMQCLEASPATAAGAGIGDYESPSSDSPSLFSHLMGVVPNNIVRPLLEGNVLSLLLVAFAVGIGLSRLPDSENKRVVVKGLQGLQELLFLLIGWLIRVLPAGIVAFAAQLSAQLSAGIVAGALGKYIIVVMGGNVLQFFVVLPLFLLARGINPLRTLSNMSPAVLTALFTKSSAATLPVTMNSAEQRQGVKKETARFVLPVCTTINMNGCAAFILVTSLFVLQTGGTAITLSTILLWLVISVVAAIGNAGVPMGCYFLTFSLMAGMGAPVAVLGLILPVYTLIDMVETAENVWSDSCVCVMVDQDLKADN